MTDRHRTTSHELERYAGLFAARTQQMRSSAMRDLMAVTARPEIISLAGGLPDTSTFPAESFAASMNEIARRSLPQALQYGPTEGFDATKRCIAEVMAKESMRIDPDDVIVTTGGQQVIDLVTKTFVDPGDVVICEAPTYPGAVPVLSSYEADVRQIEMDRDGMRVDLLEEMLEQLDREKKVPKYIYTVPTFHNPAGVTMSLPRRKRLVEIARQREIIVLEDNPYGLLRYEGDPLPTLFALDRGEYVIYLGTFSKIISPGIRLGWLVGPAPVNEKINLGKQAVDLCTSSLTQHMVLSYFAEGHWQQYVQSLAEIYRRRRDVMLEALAEFFPPEAEWTEPQGGIFIWATLPDFIDSQDLLAKALSANVAFVPGPAAYVDGRGASSMRLNFSGVTDDEIREGIRRIGAVIREQIVLYSTLTGRPAAAREARPAGSEREGDAIDPAAPAREGEPSTARADSLAKVLKLPRTPSSERRASR